jgi:hypothetical protein
MVTQSPPQINKKEKKRKEKKKKKFGRYHEER